MIYKTTDIYGNVTLEKTVTTEEDMIKLFIADFMVKKNLYEKAFGKANVCFIGHHSYKLAYLMKPKVGLDRDIYGKRTIMGIRFIRVNASFYLEFG